MASSAKLAGLTGILSVVGAAAAVVVSSGSPTTSQSVRATAASTWSYSTFSYEQMTSDRFPTPLPAPLTIAKPYAPHFTEASTLLPTNVTYTTYSLAPSATISPDGQYGQSAYAALWENYTYSHEPPFTTTASPTPILSSELVYPPQLPARPLNDNDGLKFPADFVWGVAASAWQVEGGLQLEGRGPALLDSTGVNGQGTLGTDDANVADMHYFLYKQDIARLAALGVPYFSFSISWSRVVPFGVAGSPVNQEALDHYDDVINTCLEYGVTPIATLMHIDAPTSVFGADEFDEFPGHFVYYAKQVMTRYGDRVPYWVTFNEPNVAPMFFPGGYGRLTAFLLAHAEVYHWYKDVLHATGKLTMKFANNLALPLDPSNPDDVAAAHRYQDFIIGIMGNPLFLGRQYPDVVLNTPNINLPPLTDAQIATINGTMDYWAFDPYGAQYATSPPGGHAACAANSSDPLWPSCATLGTTQANGWALGALSEGGAVISPAYVREQLGYVWNMFRPAGGVMVTEFGFPQYGDAETPLAAQRFDLERSLYYQNFLTEMLRAISLDGVNVIGALAWSWIDNNEFGTFGHQYGMIGVNRSDPELKRWIKRSFFDFVDFFHAHI
ncbi:beta-glucosidase [Colletotrichum plurivorum]|uniref:Beta-glucosidase n=1 Tax=Colletotrichum plurivorum TaxID=2175906 RepID=A0A8H6KWA2_9PEZI|nr:beta-glucosidase [Colletotrichum plurivorum]